MNRVSRPQRTSISRFASAGAFAWVLTLWGTSEFASAQENAGSVVQPAADETPPRPLSVNDAKELLNRGEYAEAAKAFEPLAGSDDPKSLSAALGLAECRVRVGEYAAALELLVGRESSAAPTSAPWHLALARIHLVLGRYEDVLKHANEAIKLKPELAGARLLVADTLELLGRRDQATEAYRWFEKQVVERGELPRDPAWITDAAVGFARYSVLTQTHVQERTRHALQDMLQVVYDRLDRTYWPARIAAGDLLRARFNNDEETGSVADYNAALRINPNLCEAHVGLGEVALENWGFEEIEKRADDCLKVNPRYGPALNLLGKKLIFEKRYAQAIEKIDEALSVNPNDIEALALRAAASACLYDRPATDRALERIAKINPRSSTTHLTVGYVLTAIRQFADAEREFEKAISLDPTDANARAEMGMMYMNWGDEDKARAALEAAWALDQYNERTKHTLELLDKLQKFAKYESKHFIVKYDAEQDPGLGEYIAGFLEGMYDEVTDDYEAEPETKTIIEIYPSNRALGVRITGKPFIHTVGASTGRIIAMASSRDATDLVGTYNLEKVLKHEFVHTVTLAATENRIPHWFTEGLAVHQEDSPPAFSWCSLLAEAARYDRLFTLESIDWGFIRPKQPNDRQMAYAQSEWMVEYIVERFGYAAINEMIQRYRKGETQPQVYREQLKLNPTEFDRDFHEWAKKRLAGFGFDVSKVEDPDELRKQFAADSENAALQGRLAKAEHDAAETDRAIADARNALERDENEPTALETLVTVLHEESSKEADPERRRSLDDTSLPLIERLQRVRPQSWIGPKYRADIAMRRKEWDTAIEALKQLQRVCPMDPASWSGLSGIYLERGDEDAALPQLLELAKIEEHGSEVPAKVGDIYRKRGAFRDAHFWYRRALAIEPFKPQWHKALGDVSMQLADTPQALREYTMLTKLSPTYAPGFEAAAFAAHKLGDSEAAKKFATRAVELNPSSTAKSILN